MNGDSECFNIVGAVGPAGKIRQIELDLVPAFIQSHGHCTYKWLNSSRRLIVRRPESSSNILIIEHLHLEGKVFF